MKASKDFLGEHNIKPYISFKDGKAHIIELVSDQKDTIKDGRSGELIEGIKYDVKENGDEKIIFSSSVSLISQLAEFPVGAIVRIEMKSRKDASGIFKSYYDVSAVDPNFTPEPSFEDEMQQ